MPRNVEIKARVQDIEVVKQRILDLKKTTLGHDESNHSYSEILKQEDVFYNLPASKGGKLKLRKVEVYTIFIHMK